VGRRGCLSRRAAVDRRRGTAFLEAELVGNSAAARPSARDRTECWVIRVGQWRSARARHQRLFDQHFAVRPAASNRRQHGLAAQDPVDDFRDVLVDRHVAPVLDLDDDVERRRRLALEHRLLGAASTRLFVAQRDALDPADQIRQRRIHHQVLERVAVGGRNELHAALGNRAGGRRFELGANLVDDDDLGHMVLDGLDHDRVLHRRGGYLHASRAAHRWVRDVAVAADLVGGVNDHHPLAEVVGQHACRFAQQRRLTNSRTAHHQDAATGFDDVADDGHGAEDGPPDAAGDADDAPLAIANRGDAVQRAFDARAIVVAEGANALDDIVDVFLANGVRREQHFAPGHPRLGFATQVHDHFEEIAPILKRLERVADVRREHLQ
jgi:hypothetical protein